jgi:hypothetical protein
MLNNFSHIDNSLSTFYLEDENPLCVMTPLLRALFSTVSNVCQTLKIGSSLGSGSSLDIPAVVGDPESFGSEGKQN